MYAFVDRPVSTLPAGGQFLLASMRRWAEAHLAHHCPAAALMESFAAAGAHGALRHFNMAMMLLTHDAQQPLSFSSTDFCRVGDDEAILLSLWADLGRGRDANANATLALLVSQTMFMPASRAFSHTVMSLTVVGIDVAALPEDQKEAGR